MLIIESTTIFDRGSLSSEINFDSILVLAIFNNVSLSSAVTFLEISAKTSSAFSDAA
ncbi:MAG: Uncharacterised protein [Candidatus Nitrosopelagicus brevis]|nr:MAG: Uncharacterised protein [Candidatus Nitrosopelagicus brevis]